MSLLLKTSLASVLLLSLTACGSSGSSSPSVLPNDQNNNAVKVDKNLQVTNLQNDLVIPPFLIELMGRKSKALLLFKNRWTTIY